MRYLFLHVPKTAGSMFRSIVQRNFGTESAIENPLLSTQIYTTQDIESLFELYPYRIYSGHVFRLLPAQAACDGRLQLIAFVRDPIEKARSAYYYLAGRDMTRSDHPTKQRTFIEMVDFVTANGIEDQFVMDSSQLDWLVGKSGAVVGDVEASVTDGRLLLLPTEHFDQACVLLERLFAQDFTDCSYGRRQNTSSKGGEGMLESERAAAARLPWIERDAALHDLACSTMDALARQVFPTPEHFEEAMLDFHSRCAERERKERGPQKDLSLLRRVARRAMGLVR